LAVTIAWLPLFVAEFFDPAVMHSAAVTDWYRYWAFFLRQAAHLPAVLAIAAVAGGIVGTTAARRRHEAINQRVLK
jgi:hypothetical protein